MPGMKEWVRVDNLEDLFESGIGWLCPAHNVADHLTATERNPHTAADPDLLYQVDWNGVGEGFIDRRNDRYLCGLYLWRRRRHFRDTPTQESREVNHQPALRPDRVASAGRGQVDPLTKQHTIGLNGKPSAGPREPARMPPAREPAPRTSGQIRDILGHCPRPA